MLDIHSLFIVHLTPTPARPGAAAIETGGVEAQRKMYNPDDNPGFPPDDPRLHDFRWRRVAVSTARLSELVQDIVPGATVMGLHLVCTGGYWELIVHSPAFAPAPNDGELLRDTIPLLEGV